MMSPCWSVIFINTWHGKLLPFMYWEQPACYAPSTKLCLETHTLKLWSGRKTRTKRLTHLRRKFKKWSDFHETLYTLPKGRGKNMRGIFFFLYLV